MIELTRSELAHLLTQAATLGAIEALTQTGNQKPYLSKTEAYKIYGEGAVDRWIAEEIVTARQDGPRNSKWRLSRTELEAAAKASHRATYIVREQF